MSETLSVPMTISEIAADLIEVTGYGDSFERFVNGRVTVTARGGGRTHTWTITDPAVRCWPGQVVDVNWLMDDTVASDSTPLVAPDLDLRRSQYEWNALVKERDELQRRVEALRRIIERPTDG